MRKNMIFGVIGFALTLVTGGYAFATLAEGEISMGMFSIPLPSNGIDGKDGCAPLIRSTEKDANNCYEIQQNVQTWDNDDKKCKPVMDGSNNQVWTKITEICDGKDGEDAGIDNVSGVYVPYPQSKGTCSGGTCQYPDRQGYLTTTVSFTDSARQPVVTISLDPCEVFYDETDDNKPKKKCTAQGDATAWLNSDGTGNYEANESYIFEISDPATTLDSGVNPNPYLEYVEPTKNASGWFENPGHTVEVTVFVNGQQKREFYAVDRCDKYKNPSDVSAEAVVKCTVGEPGKNPEYIAGTTKYCLNINPSLCDDYDLLVDDGVCAGAGDDASRTVRSTTTEYYGPSGNSSSTSRNVGYVATTQVMCSNDSDDDITATHNDPCTPASNPTVTCASGYTWQTCTNQTSTTQTYTGCFPSNLGQLFAYKDEIVPANFASDGNNLYYCQIQDCDSTSTCWIGGNKANGPAPNGKLNGTNCWGVVSIDGLQGDAGPGCSFAYYNNQWQVCCLPVDASGNVNVNGSWSCKEVTDTGILNQLNNWMCKPTYTTYYIDKQTNGNYVYSRATATNERSANTVGIRTKITNCDGTFGGDVDVFDGTDGAPGGDYDPCDDLTAGSQDALSRVHHTTGVYVPHGNGNNGTTTGIGYYQETNVMCDTNGNKIVKKYDKCEPVSLASGASRTVGTTTCSGNETLLLCTPQQGNDLTPYPVCSGAEVSGYPKLEYVQPLESNDKFTAEGYTRWVHKYTATGIEVVGDVNRKDSCHPVYKLSRTNSNNTVTATTRSVQKCQIQSPGTTTGFTADEWYCLNTTNNVTTSCNGYSDTISDSETSTLKYHLPIMDTTDTTKPIGAGYTYYDVTDGNNVTVREIRKDKDSCDLVYRKANTSTTLPETTWKCVVQSPGDTAAGATYTTSYNYCLNIAGGACTNYQDTPSAPDQCNGSTDATAVKSVVSRTYARDTNSQGALTSVYKMCNDDDHAETTPDECYEIPTPASQTCTNGVWMQCKRQANEGTDSATALGTTYGYCAVYPQCVENPSSSTVVRNTQHSYTGPSGGGGSGNKTYYTTVGKVKDVKIACNGTTVVSTDESAEDQCEEVADTTSICPSTAKVLKKCKRKGDENSSDKKAETEYNLCTTGLSIAASDPCGGDTTSDDAKKKVKNIQYEYVAPVSNTQAKRVGYSVKTTTMCNPAGNTTEYIYDTCEPIAASDNCKNGTTYKPYYNCHKQTYDATDTNASQRDYKACDPLPVAVALSSAVAGKLDSDVSFEVKPNSQAGNKDYITITGSNIADKPVVALESLQGASVFDIWKEEQTNDNKCDALFGKSCDELVASDMLLDLSAQGNWARNTYETSSNPSALSHSDLGATQFQNSLKPCQSFRIEENDQYQGGDGKQYVMTCVE